MKTQVLILILFLNIQCSNHFINDCKVFKKANNTKEIKTSYVNDVKIKLINDYVNVRGLIELKFKRKRIVFASMIADTICINPLKNNYFSVSLRNIKNNCSCVFLINNLGNEYSRIDFYDKSFDLEKKEEVFIYQKIIEGELYFYHNSFNNQIGTVKNNKLFISPNFKKEFVENNENILKQSDPDILEKSNL